MDVVKKQNALATRFEPPHRQSNLLAPDAVMPVIGDGVGWEYRKPTRREFAFEGSPSAALMSEMPRSIS